MKRWQVSETERKVLDRVLSEHLRARKARTEAVKVIREAEARIDSLPVGVSATTSRFIASNARENLAASREVVVLTRDLTHLLRRF